MAELPGAALAGELADHTLRSREPLEKWCCVLLSPQHHPKIRRIGKTGPRPASSRSCRWRTSPRWETSAGSGRQIPPLEGTHTTLAVNGSEGRHNGRHGEEKGPGFPRLGLLGSRRPQLVPVRPLRGNPYSGPECAPRIRRPWAGTGACGAASGRSPAQAP